MRPNDSRRSAATRCGRGGTWRWYSAGDRRLSEHTGGKSRERMRVAEVVAGVVGRVRQVACGDCVWRPGPVFRLDLHASNQQQDQAASSLAVHNNLAPDRTDLTALSRAPLDPPPHRQARPPAHLRHGRCRYASRLRAHQPHGAPHPRVDGGVQQELRHLGGLAAAGLTRDNHNLAGAVQEIWART